MSYVDKKFLNAAGITQIVQLLDDYATNDTLSTVVNQIDNAISAKYTKPNSGIPASDLAAGVIPTVPVTDVQIDGTSILSNGVANIPVGDFNTYGVYKVGYGLLVNVGTLQVQAAGDSNIKAGEMDCYPIVPCRQHTSVFYGLSKLAGEDLKNATVTVGTYPDSSKQAIQKLLGLDGILGNYESATASKAYAVGETFIYNGKRYRVTVAIAQSDVIAPGTNCELDPLDGKYVRNTDYATSSTAGLVQVNASYGISFYSNNDKTLTINPPSLSQVKAGSNSTRPLVAYYQHASAFYGLAKAAGDTTQASSSNTIGDYTQSAKTAIQTMLGIESDIPLVETLTGATLSITGMPNVRYICDTAISELTITPPASGSIVVRFIAGSNCIVALPQTVKLPEWFDISSLEAGTTYEFIITDGIYGGVMSWAT